jgi:catalase
VGARAYSPDAVRDTSRFFRNMSDRGISRWFQTIEGFGAHTFRLVNAEGGSSRVKFHWGPVPGVHSIVWRGADRRGVDRRLSLRGPDGRHRRGCVLEWELSGDADDGSGTFEGIDLLDRTKLIPSSWHPCSWSAR